MINVKVRDNESFERALKRFTKACEKSGLMPKSKNTCITKNRANNANVKKTLLAVKCAS